MIALGDGVFFDGTRDELRKAMMNLPEKKPAPSYGAMRPNVKFMERARPQMDEKVLRAKRALDALSKRCICCGGPATACGMH